MKNHVESSCLRGQEGNAEGVVIGGLTLIAAAALLYYADPGFMRGIRTTLNEPEFHQGSEVVFTQPAAKFSIVYVGQQVPKCPGDIDKVIPIINKAGEIRGVNVICKPGASEPKPLEVYEVLPKGQPIK